MAQLAAIDEEIRKETVAAVVVETAPPQLPAELERCLKLSLRAKQVSAKSKKQPAGGQKTQDSHGVQATSPSADALVLAEQKTKRQRELCAYQLLKWHEEQRQKVAKK